MCFDTSSSGAFNCFRQYMQASANYNHFAQRRGLKTLISTLFPAFFNPSDSPTLENQTVTFWYAQIMHNIIISSLAFWYVVYTLACYKVQYSIFLSHTRSLSLMYLLVLILLLKHLNNVGTNECKSYLLVLRELSLAVICMQNGAIAAAQCISLDQPTRTWRKYGSNAVCTIIRAYFIRPSIMIISNNNSGRYRWLQCNVFSSTVCISPSVFLSNSLSFASLLYPRYLHIWALMSSCDHYL